MTVKPSPEEVRRRVRLIATPQLLLIVGGLQNAEVNGPAPAGAIARLEALRDEAAIELGRRGIAVAADSRLVARMTYVGDANGTESKGAAQV